MPAIALYQPDIPQNVGAAMRLCACMGTQLHIIEPCGFPWDERKIRQSGMDYVDQMEYSLHASWEKFRQATPNRRIILLTTKGADSYYDFKFQPTDILLAGRESAGVPDDVHNAADARLLIPMTGTARSLNVVNALSMVLGEAIRQLK
jgi:tRNA (cytidine/uridine-2'-O-)-methyltransferase